MSRASLAAPALAIALLALAACSADDATSAHGGADVDSSTGATTGGTGASGGVGGSGGGTETGARAGATADAGAPEGSAGVIGAAGADPAQGGAAGLAGGGSSGAAGADIEPDADVQPDGDADAAENDDAGQDPGPDAGHDACADVAPWDPTESWTSYEVGELRTLRGALWRCQNPTFCQSYPGSPDSPGWLRVAMCTDPSAGGEPACQCSTGTCCDGCYWRPTSYFCGEFVYSSRCDLASSTCSGYLRFLTKDYRNLFCGGDSSECTRWTTFNTKSTSMTCPAPSVCIDRATGGDDASCVPCPN